MNSAYYSKLIRRTVSCDMQRAFPEGEEVFQQDLAPCHTSKQVKKVFKAAINILNWPGNSLDFNQIQNFW